MPVEEIQQTIQPSRLESFELGVCLFDPFYLNTEEQMSGNVSVPSALRIETVSDLMAQLKVDDIQQLTDQKQHLLFNVTSSPDGRINIITAPAPTRDYNGFHYFVFIVGGIIYVVKLVMDWKERQSQRRERDKDRQERESRRDKDRQERESQRRHQQDKEDKDRQLLLQILDKKELVTAENITQVLRTMTNQGQHGNIKLLPSSVGSTSDSEDKTKND